MRRSLPLRKPTPAEIGALITEDVSGLPLTEDVPGMPLMGASPVSPAVSPAGSLSSYNGDDSPEPHAHTQMRTCVAECCVHNEDGGCRLDNIDINQYGGCQQYEASADDAEASGNQARYKEIETADPTGGSEAVPVYKGQASRDGPDSQRGSNGPWDPRGGGY